MFLVGYWAMDDQSHGVVVYFSCIIIRGDATCEIDVCLSALAVEALINVNE
jgi:hypothetical protein